LFIAFYAVTPLATHPHLHCSHRVKRFSCRTCSGRVSKTKCGSFPQYRKFFGSVIGPREVEGNLKHSKPHYINNIIYMYSVEHNNVFILLVATSSGRYDRHQASDIQNLQWLVACSAQKYPLPKCCTLFLAEFISVTVLMCRSQWPRSPRCGSAVARLLGL
jgi:hypothetical protein